MLLLDEIGDRDAGALQVHFRIPDENNALNPLRFTHDLTSSHDPCAELRSWPSEARARRLSARIVGWASQQRSAGSATRTCQGFCPTIFMHEEKYVARPDKTIRFEWRGVAVRNKTGRSEEHTSELHSLMRISYAVFCLKKNQHDHTRKRTPHRKTK